MVEATSEAATTAPVSAKFCVACINVARVLHRLGADCLALYTQGGVTGHELATLLAQEGVPAQGLPIAAETRESFSVHENSTGLDYRFVLPGPRLQPAEVERAL